MGIAQARILPTLERAGITINGPATHDLQVHNPAVYGRVLRYGNLGFGEAYMDGQWDCDDLTELLRRLLEANPDKSHHGLSHTLKVWAKAALNPQTAVRSLRVARVHYDLSIVLYRLMLGTTMAYTCGYWKDARTLDEAQAHKLDLVCRKIGLKKGDRVLDVGCGWGSFAKYAAERYGADVVGITISEVQAEEARKRCEGLSVGILLLDYRKLPEEFSEGYFDHIVSLGMFEHVGPKNHRTYMQTLMPLLKRDGLFLLHTIGGSEPGFDPWIDRYIFPDGRIPTLGQITESIRGLFYVEDLHNFGLDYARTLRAWFENFDRAWPVIKASGNYDDRFYRMWKYYLCSCEASFLARGTHLWQFVLARTDTERDTYVRVL